ncbi:MAG: hypothetical protein ABSH44_17555 [Bryobacteraceae bacterium]|jgi:hypothetical protein
MKKLLAVAMFAVFTAFTALAQNPVQRYASVANAGAGGTTLATITSLTGAPSTAVKTTTGCTGIVGVTVGGAGTTGNAIIATSGSVSIVFDGDTVAGHYFTCSTTVAGNAHDTGASTFPASGWAGGVVLTTNTGTGTYAALLFPQVAVAGANTSLGNLVSPVVNATFEFAATKGIGDTTAPPQYIYFYGGGTQGTDSFRFAGTPSGNQDVTFSGSGTVGYRLIGTASITPASLVDGACADQGTTIALTGAVAGDPVKIGPPSTLAAGLFVTGVTTATNTVTVRLCNLSGGALTPASGTYTATIVH